MRQIFPSNDELDVVDVNITQAKEILKEDLSFQAAVDFAGQVVHDMDLSKDAKILDVGTGEGNMSLTLALNGYHVITGEPEDDTSDYSKKDWASKANKLQVDQLITFKPFKAENLPFDNGMFDAIFLLGCLHHIQETARADVMKECVRTTSPAGTICVIEPTEAALELIRKAYPEHPDTSDPRSYTQGLNLSEETKTDDLFTAYIFRKRN